MTWFDPLQQEFLREILYQDEHGHLHWSDGQPRSERVFGNMTIRVYWGWRYQYVAFGSVKIRAETVIWMMHTGDWIEGAFRYRNGDKADLRFENLIAPRHREP